LLGFVPRATTEELPLSQLRSPEELLDHLAELRYPQPSALANLSQWIQGAIDEGWQTLEELLNPAQLSPAIAFRGRLGTQTPSKRIDLNGVAAVLAVDARPLADESTDICLQLHPPIDGFLPIGTRFSVLNEVGEVELETTATGTEDFLEWQVGCTSGDRFSVQVSLNEVHITQDFVI